MIRTWYWQPAALLLVAGILASGPADAAVQSRQEHVHDMGRNVMPFDLGQTTHVFLMTEAGGVQRIVAKVGSAKDQIALIQMHLRKERDAFARDDYTDPASLHGATMPGLKELRAGSGKVRVSYRALPDGAEIRFETTDIHLLTAIHRWFGAQLSEHGADARSE